MGTVRTVAVLLVVLLAALGVLVVTVPTLKAAAKEHARSILFYGAQMPAPTGPHAVGLEELGPLVEGRPIPVDFWYPAAPAPTSLTTRMQVLRSSLLHPGRAPAMRGADMMSGDRPRPLILYLSPGGGRRDSASHMLANLASHGYAVVALDDPQMWPQPAISQPSTRLDHSSDEAFTRSVDAMGPAVTAVAATVSSVLDTLAAMPRWSERVAFKRIAALGYSFGGSIAAELSRQDERIRAVINMDGSTYGGAAADGVDVPYLFLFGEGFFVSPDDLENTTNWVRHEAELTLIEIERVASQAGRPAHVTLVAPQLKHAEFGDRLIRPTFDEFRSGRQIDRAALWLGLNEVIIGFVEATIGSAAQNPSTPSELPDGIIDLERARAVALARGSLLP